MKRKSTNHTDYLKKYKVNTCHSGIVKILIPINSNIGIFISSYISVRLEVITLCII